MKPQDSPQQTRFPVVAYPDGWRYLVAGLFALGRLSLLAMAFMFFLGWVISPPLLVRLVVFLALVPGLLTILLRKIFAADLEVSEGQLSLRRTGLYRRQDLAVEPADIHEVKSWWLPAPGPGLLIWLAPAAGSRRLTLETRHSLELLALLSRLVKVSTIAPKIEEASRVYSQAKEGSRVARWHWPMVKFGLFGLFPVLVVFRLHQNIMYGGLFGQYHLYGPGPWLSSLAYHWIMVTIYLVLYAAFWRAWVESACWLSARFAPAHAGTVRRWGEILALTVYFAGIPAFIVWRSV